MAVAASEAARVIVYFDESYDAERHYLLYGALFVPASSTLHQQVLRIRRETEFTGEVKYNTCKNAYRLRVCTRVIDAFMKDSAYFRCVVVDQYRFDYSGFGGPDEPVALKQARAYKKFAEMLLAPHLDGVVDAVFIADRLTRCDGDEFLERIRERFNVSKDRRTFRHLAEADSGLEEHQCLQVCDLLLGCVLNNLRPTKKPTKNRVREILCERLGVKSFLLSSWRTVPLDEAASPSTKFNVWYWSAKGKPR